MSHPVMLSHGDVGSSMKWFDCTATWPSFHPLQDDIAQLSVYTIHLSSLRDVCRLRYLRHYRKEYS